jgi:hypothetical protein
MKSSPGPHHPDRAHGVPRANVLKAIRLRTTLSIDDVVVADVHPNY